MLGKLATLTLATAGGVLFRRAQAEQRQQQALFGALYNSPVVVEGRSLSFLQLMSGARGLVGNHRIFWLVGVSQLERMLLLPVLLYFESCVYSGDLETEAYYRGSAALPKELTWDQSMLLAAKKLEILDEALQREVELLKAYFARESAIMRGEEVLTARAICELNTERSHDLEFLLRAALRLLGRPAPEPLLAVMRPWLAYREIIGDLPTYDEDVAEGSFNTLQMLERIYGVERGLPELEKLCNALLDDQLRAMQQLESRQIGRILNVILNREYGVPLELCGPLAVATPRKALFYAAEKVLRANLQRLLGMAPRPIAS